MLVSALYCSCPTASVISLKHTDSLPRHSWLDTLQFDPQALSTMHNVLKCMTMLRLGAG